MFSQIDLFTLETHIKYYIKIAAETLCQMNYTPNDNNYCSLAIIVNQYSTATQYNVDIFLKKENNKVNM